MRRSEFRVESLEWRECRGGQTRRSAPLRQHKTFVKSFYHHNNTQYPSGGQTPPLHSQLSILFHLPHPYDNPLRDIVALVARPPKTEGQ